MEHDVQAVSKVSSGSIRRCGRIVLFGGNGFVGSNLRRCLGYPLVAPSEDDADLTNYDSLCQVLLPGDIIINAAGYANATDTTDRGKLLLQAVNVDGVENLARAAVEKAAAQLIHISSVAAMGRQRGEGITEDTMIPVTSPYAASKLAGEQVLSRFADKLPITILRPTSVFGEGRGLARTLCGVVSHGIIPLPGGGKAKIPFTYIDNVARGVELTLGNENCFGRTFIVGDLQSYPLLDIVRELADAMHVKPRIISVPCTIAQAGVNALELIAKARGSSPMLDSGRLETLTSSVSYSVQALQAATGYQPPYSLRQAIERIAAWYVGK